MRCIACRGKIEMFEAFYMFFERHPDYVLFTKREAYMCHECFKGCYKHEWGMSRVKAWHARSKETGEAVIGRYFYCSHECKHRPGSFNLERSKKEPPWTEQHLVGIALKEPYMGWGDLGREMRASYYRTMWHADCVPEDVQYFIDLAKPSAWGTGGAKIAPVLKTAFELLGS